MVNIPLERCRNFNTTLSFLGNSHGFEKVPDKGIVIYKKNFVSKYSPSNSAPLPSGKLCPRMEYGRCALHGPIVDRDEQGFPVLEQPML